MRSSRRGTTRDQRKSGTGRNASRSSGRVPFDRGDGPPLVVIPGVQGRWEWMRPALTALQATCRTITYTLCGDAGAGMRFDRALGFENYMRQLDEVFESTGAKKAAICGVSYGGFIALRYAATRPDRVSALILVSAPAPGWTPSARQQRYLARPWRSAPAFVATAPARVWPEIASALPDWRSRLTFTVKHSAQVVSAPMMPSRMANRVHLQQASDFGDDPRKVRAPTLIITGEDHLDQVVPPPVTRWYLDLIPGSRYEKLAGTGHIGMLTQPKRFAEIVSGFVHAHSH
jgi:pimeloyl-ACP methyl ester carboxylesterase